MIDIIPLEELPPNSPDYFTYFSTNYIKKFSLVKIELKNKIKVGIVKNVKPISKKEAKNLNFILKNIKDIVKKEIFISEIQERFAHWISKNYFISLAHAFCFFTNFYKKIITDVNEPKPEYGGGFESIYLKNLNEKIINNPPSLILTSTEEEAKILKGKIKNSFLIDLNYPPKKFSELLKKILNKEQVIFIGSKNCIFLPWQKLNSIVIYKEGDIFYKEFFRRPYFNYLNLVEKLAKLLKTKLILIDKFPTLKTIVKFKLKPDLNFYFKKFKDLDNLLEILRKYNTSKIFTPLKSLGEKLYCNHCFYEVNCKNCNYPLTIFENKLFCRVCFKEFDLLDKCPRCGLEELSLKKFGGLWIKNFLEKNGFFTIFINDEKDIKKFLQKNYKRYILIGSLYLLNPFIPKTESSIFLNFDSAFYSYNIFLKERNLRILKKLIESSNEIFIQTNLNEEILKTLENGEILNIIFSERKENFLPPYSRIIKLIGRLKNLQELNNRLLIIKDELNNRRLLFNKRIEIMGPFLERIEKRIKRYQMFLLLKTEDGVDLKKLLKDLKYIEEIRCDEENI